MPLSSLRRYFLRYFKLDDVEAFFSSNAPEEEKKQLREYTERLAIMIDSSPRLPSVPGRRGLLSLLFREGLHALRAVALPPVGP